ncbi:MAG: rhomboid family intramembrane serine protease [Candidatus Thermoplasmatota archaeon]
MEILVVGVFAAMVLAPYALALARKGWISHLLIVSNVLVFIYMILLALASPRFFNFLDRWAVFETSLVHDPLAWHRAFWSMAIHGGPMHLLGNMLVLYFIGMPLEERVGTHLTMMLYVIAGFFGTLAFVLFHWGEGGGLVGASGAIFGLMGALLILYPRDEIAMFLGPIFMRRVPVYIAVGVLVLMETLFVAIEVQDNVAHVAHLGGFAAGALLAPALRRAAGVKGRARASYERLKPLATTPELRHILQRIEDEEVPEVARAWLDEFLKAARCPDCGAGVRHLRGRVRCAGCGRLF